MSSTASLAPDGGADRGATRGTTRRRLALAILTCIAFAGCCAGVVWREYRTHLELDVGAGRVLRVWAQGCWGWEFANDHCGDGLFYEVREGGNLGHPCWLAPARYQPEALRVFTTADKELTAVYVRARSHFSGFAQEHLLMFDGRSGESYPRLRDDETSQMPAVRAKWDERYQRLKQENPALPDMSGMWQ